MESLQNGVVTHFQMIPLFSIRAVWLASSQSHHSVNADVWCKRALRHVLLFSIVGIGDYRGKSGKWTEMDRDGVVIDSPEEEKKEESQPSPAKRARFSRSLSGWCWRRSSVYTGSRLRVRLLRATGYSEQIIFIEKKTWFNVIMWCCLHLMIKRSEVLLRKVVMLTVHVNEPLTFKCSM